MDVKIEVVMAQYEQTIMELQRQVIMLKAQLQTVEMDKQANKPEEAASE